MEQHSATATASNPSVEADPLADRIIERNTHPWYDVLLSRTMIPRVSPRVVEALASSSVGAESHQAALELRAVRCRRWSRR